MKKNNAALWGTGLIGALICIIVDLNYVNTGWLGLAGAAVALVCSYFFLNGVFKMLTEKTEGTTEEALAQEKQAKEEELETAGIRAQIERERQESLEKKLDELILVEKAVYTMLKKEAEDREAAYERMENQIQKATRELLSNQEKAVKVLLKYNHDDRQSVSDAVNEEVVKVQRVIAVGQKHLISAAEELNNSISNNTKVLKSKLSDLENSIKNTNISVTAVPAEPVETMAEMPTEEMIDNIIAGLEVEEPAIEEEIFAAAGNEPEVSEDLVVDAEEDIFAAVDVKEETPVEKEMDDPNRAMTPEEIAALIASVGGGDSKKEEAPAPQPEPEPEPEPVENDPNRAMTPEEIAALIASMN